MKTMSIIRMVSCVAVAAALSALCLMGVGCTTTSTSSNTQAANRLYMASVNSIMAEFSDELEDFSAAALDADVVKMSQIVDRATTVLDKISALTAPDAMKSVHTDYVDGAAAMKSALKNYINLYKQLKDELITTDEFNAQLSGVRTSYDEAYDKLQKADTALAAMK